MFKSRKTVSERDGEVAVLQVKMGRRQVITGIVMACAEIAEEVLAIIATVHTAQGTVYKRDLFGVETAVVQWILATSPQQ